MTISTNELENKLNALNIPGKVVKTESNPFSLDIYVEFSTNIPFGRIKSHNQDISILYGTDIEIIPEGKATILRVPYDSKSRPIVTIWSFRTEIIDKKISAAIPIAIGKDVSGKRIFSGLEKMPHLLVAGTTGSGKSMFLHTTILSILFGGSSALALFDMKRVEFSLYEGIPNLYSPIAYDVYTAKDTISRICNEMDKRYEDMQFVSARNIDEYNKCDVNKKMYYITCVIDELADLLLSDKTIEKDLVRIAQLGRACGIHLIIATQRPDSKILSGLLRANIPSRMCFAVQNSANSRVILDQPGGEKLIGNGDGLYWPMTSREPIRVQCPLISTEEIANYIKYNVIR